MLDFIIIYSKKDVISPEIQKIFCEIPQKNCMFDYRQAEFFLSSSQKRLGIFYATNDLQQHFSDNKEINALNDLNGAILFDYKLCKNSKEVMPPVKQKIHTGLQQHLSYNKEINALNYFDGTILYDYDFCENIEDIYTAIKQRNINIQGTYCFGKLSDNETDFIQSSVLGTYPLFWGGSDDLFIISSNPHFIVEAIHLDKLQYNPTAFKWLLACGYIGDLSTPYDGVYQFPNNAGIQISPVNIPTFYALEPDIYAPHTREEWDTLFDRAYTSFVDHVYAIGKQVQPLYGNITGGYDSRTVLAAAIKAGVHQNFNMTVAGYPDHPDVIVSKLIAKKFSLNLSVYEPETVIGLRGNWLDVLKESLFCTGGMREGSEFYGGIADCSKPKPYSLDGVGGECFRGFYSIHYALSDYKNQISSIDIFKSFLQRTYKACFNVNPLINHIAKYAHSICRTIYDIDFIYCLAKIPQYHAGLSHKIVHSFSSTRPALNTLLHSAAFTCQSDLRRACNINWKIIENSCPELLKIPFADKKWDTLNYANRSDVADFCQIQPMKNLSSRPNPAALASVGKCKLLKVMLQTPTPSFLELFSTGEQKISKENMYTKWVLSHLTDEKISNISPSNAWWLMNVAGANLFLSNQLIRPSENSKVIPSRINFSTKQSKFFIREWNIKNTNGFTTQYVLKNRPLSLANFNTRKDATYEKKSLTPYMDKIRSKYLNLILAKK